MALPARPLSWRPSHFAPSELESSCKIRPMMSRSALRLAALLTVLAFLLPLAALADSCTDCLRAASEECCPPACCSCCAHGPSVLTASIGGAPRRSTVDRTPISRDDRFSAFHPRDVFHVPKPSLP